MRYQQKQMHENAQKKSDMFDETQKLLTSSLGAGKVRIQFQLFWRRIFLKVQKLQQFSINVLFCWTFRLN